MRSRGVLVIVLALGMFAPARAQRAEADAAFRRGRVLMDKGETAQACAEFETSMRLDPQSGTLYNLALCHEQLGKIATAWSELTELAATDANKARAQDSGRRAHALEPKLTRMRIVVRDSVAGLVILRDGVDVTALVDQSVPVDPKRYKFVVTAPGREPAEIEVALQDPGVVEVAIPTLAKRADPAPRAAVDAYALNLVDRPLALPRRVIEVSAFTTLSTSATFPTDPIDVFATGRMGLGVVELEVGTGSHLLYSTETDRADALILISLGGRYIINPRFTGSLTYTTYHPTGAPETGSDIDSRLARKYILAPNVALVGQAGAQFSQRTRSNTDRQEFAFIGRGAVQLAAVRRLSFEAATDITVNMGGDLYRHTFGMVFSASALVALNRHYDVFAGASFVVAPSESDLKRFVVGVNRRIP